MPNTRTMYLAPFDAIWLPLLLLSLATLVGLASAWLESYVLMGLAAIGFAISTGDCFGRSKDYLNARRRFADARDELETYEVVRRFRRAWCARVACSAAWKRERSCQRGGSKRYVDDTYYELGYRWWHIFPDGTFTKNSPFLKTAFWVHLFTGKMKRDQVDAPKPRMEATE